MILCVGTTPAAQRVMRFRRLELDAVNRAVATTDGIAGKSINVAKVLKALGAHPFATGFLGGSRGEELRRALVEKAIEHEFISVPAPTRQCITVLDEAGGTITELVEESGAVPAESFELLKKLLLRRAGGCCAMVLSGTVAPGGPPAFYADCVRVARQSSALAVVDAQGPVLQMALAERPGLAKPNRRELEHTLGRALRREPDVLEAMRQLQGAGAERVIVTSGKEPSLAFDGANFWRIHPPPVAALNPIGSGDAFTAGLVWSLTRGDDLGEACRWGTAAGAANALTLMPGELEPATVHQLAPAVRVESIDS